MTLQNAKAKVKKAIRLMEFAKERNLPFTNFANMAFHKCRPKLSFTDFVKFEEWYSKQ